MKRVLFLLILLLTILPTFASENKISDIMYADVPLTYGEDSFRSRILERTEGKRDPIGLVLTGGSARAFAHLGVLQYLEEQEIEPDFIISNSMGSIIAMLYASGLSSQQILEVITSGELSTFFKLTAPLQGGILDPTGFKGLVQSVVGKDVQIEELPIPIMVICQDLVTKREIRIMEGPFADVLIGSFALPFYFPPQDYKGHLLIDGGIITLAPIATAYEYTDTVIVSTTFYDNEDINLKNFISIINVGYDIGKRRNAAIDIRKYQDSMIWIRCAVESYSFMQFSAAGELAKIGYQSAKREEERLSQLYKHGMSRSIFESRVKKEQFVDKVGLNQYYFARVEQPDVAHNLSLGVYSFQGNDYPYYLRDTFDFGFEYSWKYKFLEVSALLGNALDLSADKHTSSSFMISSSLYYYPTINLRLSLYGAFTLDNEDVWYYPSTYLRAGLDYKFYSDSIKSFEFSQALEWNNQVGENDNKDQTLLSSRLLGTIKTSLCNLKLNLGFLLSSYNNLQNANRFYGQAGLETRLYLIKGKNYYFDLGFLSRFALDNRDGVQIYTVDGFLTNNQAIMETSKYDDDISLGIKQKYLVVLPLSFGYAFTKSPTFGELFMAEYLEISGYCDLLFCQGEVPAYSTGIEVQTNLSLIGLQKFPLTIRYGYDSLMNDKIFSIRFAITK